MKILAIEHELPGATAGQFQDQLQDEALAVWQLYRAEIVRELYFRADQNTAVLVLECDELAAASILPRRSGETARPRGTSRSGFCVRRSAT